MSCDIRLSPVLDYIVLQGDCEAVPGLDGVIRAIKRAILTKYQRLPQLLESAPLQSNSSTTSF